MTTPQLAEVIDAEPQALRAVLQRGLPGFADADLLIDDLRVVKLRRSSSRQRHPNPLTLCVDLDVHAPARGLRGVQRMYGKAYRQGASAAAHAQARAGALAPVAFGAPLAHLPALDMVWWAWPNDPGLPQLPELTDPLRLAPRLPAGLRRPGETVTEVQALRYEPEVRATLQATLCSPQGARMIYGKTFDDGRGEIVHQRFVAAWQQAAADPLAALVPEPLGYDAATRTLWQAAAPGVPLAGLDQGPRIDALRRLGQALGRLHDLPLTQGGDRSLAHWLLEAERRATKIGRAAPALAPRVQALVQALQAAAVRLPATALSLVHGDFHPEQVWVHEGRPLLFDFDEFALGHPMEDLASFITRLQQGPSAALAAAGKTALLQGYRQAALARWHSASLQWHLVMQALLQTSRAFVFQAPGWPAELARRFAVAEARAHEMQEHLA